MMSLRQPAIPHATLSAASTLAHVTRHHCLRTGGHSPRPSGRDPWQPKNLRVRTRRPTPFGRPARPPAAHGAALEAHSGTNSSLARQQLAQQRLGRFLEQIEHLLEATQAAVIRIWHDPGSGRRHKVHQQADTGLLIRRRAATKLG